MSNYHCSGYENCENISICLAQKSDLSLAQTLLLLQKGAIQMRMLIKLIVTDAKTLKLIFYFKNDKSFALKCDSVRSIVCDS